MRYSLPIVGARYRPPASALLAVLPANFGLVLRREPRNGFDVNAIQVLVADREDFETINPALVAERLAGFGVEAGELAWPIHLGYVPREDAAGVARIADSRRLVEWGGKLGFSVSGQPRVQFDLNKEGD